MNFQNMAQFTERGDIKHRDRAKQINSFAGLIRRRNITPTDVDGLIEYNGNVFIMLEGKYGDAELPKGQRMALENLANAILDGKKKVVIIVYRHYIQNSNQDVIVSEQFVSDVYFDKKWKKIDGYNVLQTIERFENYCDLNNFKI
jgi:hypothetical protein